jgi:hypothetical protein
MCMFFGADMARPAVLPVQARDREGLDYSHAVYWRKA